MYSDELVSQLKLIFQLLDLPGIIEGAKDGKGRGKQVIAVARTCSLIFIVLDVLKPLGHKKLIEHEMEGFGIRLNKVQRMNNSSYTIYYLIIFSLLGTSSDHF